MSRFNAGDRVIGNEKASIRYAITQKGWEGRVTKVCGEDIFVYGPGSISDIGFMVSSECFDLDSQALAPSIHITTDGKTTHAVLKEGGKVTKRAKAVCSPYDEFDFETGARIAFDRLCTSLAENSAFKGVREVKRPAKVGEYIKIVDPKYNATYTINDYVKGDIKCVLKTWGSGASFESNSKTASGNAHVWHEEYVVLEGYTPEPEKPKYYNGKVVCVDTVCGFTAGKVYAFENGQTVDDDGDIRPGDWTIGKLEDYHPTVRFIEYKGEA